MSEPYLIQHKVRGQAAFDIAVKAMGSYGQEVWIIPTGRVEVHPYWWRRLRDLCLCQEVSQRSIVELAKRVPMPDSWPSLYTEGE